MKSLSCYPCCQWPSLQIYLFYSNFPNSRSIFDQLFLAPTHNWFVVGKGLSSSLLNKNPKWAPSVRKNSPFVRVFMWFFGGLLPYLLVLAFFLIMLLLLLDSILLSKTPFFLMRCINIWTNKFRKSTEKITGNNYHTTNFINIVSWSGCGSNARPPVYQTGTAKPTELPDHCWGGRIRTLTDRSRVCSAAITPHPNFYEATCGGLLEFPEFFFLFVDWELSAAPSDLPNRITTFGATLPPLPSVLITPNRTNSVCFFACTVSTGTVT